jgi:hypothetical protein
MGTTLHAIVEVHHPASEHRRALWEGVCTWELNKDYQLRYALDEVSLKDWPHTVDGRRPPAPMDPWDDPEVSAERREVDEEDIASMRCWTDADGLQRAIAACEDFSARRGAMLAAMVALEASYGRDSVRVLFYSIT